MRAVVLTSHGDPEVLSIREVPDPRPGPTEVVVRIAVRGHDLKGTLSPLFYIAAIAATFFFEPLALVLYLAVAIIWLIPDRRMERVVHE